MKQTAIGQWPAMSVQAAVVDWQELRSQREVGVDPGAQCKQARKVPITLTLIDAATNTWAASGNASMSTSATFISTSGSKSLLTTLDRTRITPLNGTDAYDGGIANIQYQ